MPLGAHRFEQIQTFSFLLLKLEEIFLVYHEEEDEIERKLFRLKKREWKK